MDIQTPLLQLLAKCFEIILEQQSTIEQLRSNEKRDYLTGIGNRAHLDQLIYKNIESAVESNNDEACVVCILDLNKFKLINDTYGMSAGDQVLNIVSDLLRRNFRGSDCYGRYGGDEFVISTVASKLPPEKVLKRILKINNLLRERTFKLLGMVASMSIGIVWGYKIELDNDIVELAIQSFKITETKNLKVVATTSETVNIRNIESLVGVMTNLAVVRMKEHKSNSGEGR